MIMTNFVPIFPLGIVIYPAEVVNLHIFEPRYKQLIKDCRENGKSFGVPVVINKQLQEMGTLVNIVEIVSEYADGEMDIRIKAQRFSVSWRLFLLFPKNCIVERLLPTLIILKMKATGA